MYQETEALMGNYMDKLMKSRRLKQAKQVMKDTGQSVKEDAPNIFLKIIMNLLKAILFAPLAIVVMPFVDAFKNRPSNKQKGMLDNFKRDTK